MTDPAQIAMTTDPSTYVNTLVEEAQARNGRMAFLDGNSFEDVGSREVAEDQVLNELERVEE